MTTEEFNELIGYIVARCVELKNEHTAEKDLVVDYICVFSHSDNEYAELMSHASKIGKVVDETGTGPVFKFYEPLATVAGYAKVIKIRVPDTTRPERGDVDFITNYEEFKKQYLGRPGFSLIEREKFEMIELRDSKCDVLVYFSSTPPSKLLGII